MHARLVSALAAVVAVAAPLAAQGVNCQLLGTQNLHPGYANVWGYVAPNGKEYALLGCNSGTSIVDTTVPTAPVERGFIPGANSTWRELNTYLQYCYVCTEAGGQGIQVIDLSNPDAPFLANTFGTAQFSNCHTITCDTQTGRIYCNGTNNGTAVFDASVNPVNPTFVGYMTPSGTSNYFHDFHTRNGFGYASMIYNGQLRIYDLSTWPVGVVSSTATPSTFTHNAWTNAASTVCATTDERAGSFVKFFDITNKAAPVGLGQYTTNPASIPHNAYIQGNLCHVSWYTEGYILLDITDPANPVEVASYDTWPGASGGFNGAWGVYPFQPSGNVYILDMSTGLYIVRPQVTDLQVTHTPLPATTTDEDGPYQVLATVTGSNPVGSVTLHFRIGSSGPFTALAMAPTAVPDQYEGLIPGQDAPATVQYYVEAIDSVASRRTPGTGQHEFRIGTYSYVLQDDFETPSGWTHGATAGADDWQYGNSTGKSGTSGGVSWADAPAAFSGSNCWGTDLGITVNGTTYNGAYTNNVSTWLQSPAVPTNGTQGLKLRYRRWLTLAAGDTVRVLVNGALVSTSSAATGDATWQAIEHDVASITNAASTATIRFELTSNGSNVSGGWTIDDVELVAVSDQAPPLYYGTATPGTGNLAPQLAMSASARVGTTTQIQGSSLLPNGGVFLALNFAPDNLPIYGIQALVLGAGAVSQFALGSPGGAASWPFSVPNSAGFDNQYVFVQAIGLDAGSPGGFLSASQGLRFRVHLQ